MYTKVYCKLSECFNYHLCLVLQLKFVESLKKVSEEYRAQCHKQQVCVADLEARVQHLEGEAAALRSTLTETENSRQVAINNCNQLRREKEELEELVGANNGEWRPCLYLKDLIPHNFSTSYVLSE